MLLGSVLVRGMCLNGFFQIDELPRTQSGKLMEIAVAQLVNGAEITNLSAVANPGALDHIADQIQKIY